MTYIAVMAMAYYGPNAEIMGSVNLKIWHHQNVIDDIEAFAINVGLLAGVDFISFIINGFIVWKLYLWLIRIPIGRGEPKGSSVLQLL